MTVALSAAALGQSQPELGSRSAPILQIDGLRFRDLNRNGQLDVYEDWRQSPDARAKDLVARMTVAEKAGLMMHGTARSVGPMGAAGIGAQYDSAANVALIRDANVNSFITRLGGDPTALATANNSLQAIAEGTRLGIPLTISTDPRNHFQFIVGASNRNGGFSQWPETLGFAAIGDTALVRAFGDIARREYRAVGIQMTLSPQADLATEPRWSRISGTFGEDAQLARRLTRAYVQGFQGSAAGATPSGVLAVVKHWVGYGAAKDGWDSHNYYGRYANISGGSLTDHVTPFLGAFDVKVAGVMPTYSILQGATVDGKPVEQIGAGYSSQLLDDLLRKKHGFNGMIITDWLITADCPAVCQAGAPAGSRPSFADLGMPWGVETLSVDERFRKAVVAGVDQFGGEERSAALTRLVGSGAVSEKRLDESAYRVLLPKFQLGLFENPYADAAKAASIVGAEAWREQATRAQARSLVILENRKATLPVSATGKKVYLHRVAADIARKYGFTVVDDPAQADLAIVRADAPSELLHPQYMFGSMMHEGNLGFRDGEKEFEAIKKISVAAPTILTVYLDRPAILTGVNDRVAALIGNFGVSDAALLDVITGKVKAEGRLPFELPSSMAEVEAQQSDKPHDTKKPLYPIGYRSTDLRP
ncbi:MAG TPA: glycoside hydrolase family 3 N-terminal domain-containing protein [Gemmatimonadaceae bacterium]|nr:glycoside hydrolase family 3 N-terminal domain-containing protein [Gemmatimonadaceae bacterium]